MGLLGLDDRAHPGRRPRPVNALGGYRADITEQQLCGAPSFYRDRDYDWSDRARERELHDYWRAPYYWGA